MPKAIICDLDGTLADCSHRRHHLEGEKKNWDAFYAGMVDDKCNPNVRRLLKSMEQAGIEIYFVTGRPEKYRQNTTNWIVSLAYITKFALVMRPDGDFRPDHVVKREIYEKQIKRWWDVCLVLDDRASVVKMWRELGLECWQVAEGDF